MLAGAGVPESEQYPDTPVPVRPTSAQRSHYRREEPESDTQSPRRRLAHSQGVVTRETFYQVI